MLDLSLKGKTALVCGASQGLGKACAIELADLGCRVILLARNEQKLQITSKELPNQNLNHDYVAIDVSNTAKLKAQVAEKLSSTNIEILINNAGGPKAGNLLEATAEDFINAYQQHVIASHTLAQLLVPGMKQSGYGRIINILSTSVKGPIPNLGVSNTTRWAMAAWAKSLANEIGQFGITVNDVLPGSFDTTRLASLIEYQAAQKNVSTQEAKMQMETDIPLGRIGNPKEFADTVAFIASPAAAYIIGTAITVDGGRTKTI
ncbi:SDR family oxidoreductase [Francisellaceae bacterium]|nr:SDR family oxidoreductase [Francisellaceae bacterium]